MEDVKKTTEAKEEKALVLAGTYKDGSVEAAKKVKARLEEKKLEGFKILPAEGNYIKLARECKDKAEAKQLVDKAAKLGISLAISE